MSCNAIFKMKHSRGKTMIISIENSSLTKPETEALRYFFNAFFQTDFIIEAELNKIIIKEEA